ncbi:tyrosine-type recombinase/integrase [Roseibium sp. M-1]
MTPRHQNRDKRHAITYSGFRRTLATTLEYAGIIEFGIHDLRHDCASKFLRATRDLAPVRNVRKHADISPAIPYTHVLGEDVRVSQEALERTVPALVLNSSKIQ